MSQYSKPFLRRKRLSLTVYISLLLALAAFIPLIVTTGSIWFFLRQGLVQQISSDMERDAQIRVQVIDTYLSERLNDIKTLSHATTIKNLLAGDQNSRGAAFDTLATAQHRDITDYISMSLLNAHGQLVQSYPTAPLLHGKYIIVPGAMQTLQKSNDIYISDVFYDQIGNAASVDLYTRVLNNNSQIIGFVRTSLGLHRIWEPVDNEPKLNGKDSYAFILDQNRVRIAYTNSDLSGFNHPRYLFKSIGQLSPTLQQRIKDENLYGNSTASALTPIPDQNLTDQIKKGDTIFSVTPVDQQQAFQVARYSSRVVPWTYFLLKPLNVVTGLADQQLLSIIPTVLLVLIIAIISGLLIGRRITLPILRSVAALRRNSQALKTLSDEEHVVAAEQSWMIEASQVALNSVKYYTNATGVAARHIHTTGLETARGPHQLDAQSLNQALHETMETANYIEQAIKRQEAANEKLATSLRVTTQAAGQLSRGAKSTDEAATQLEQIVEQLTDVVGE